MWPSPQIKSLMENIFVCSVQKKQTYTIMLIAQFRIAVS